MATNETILNPQSLVLPKIVSGALFELTPEPGQIVYCETDSKVYIATASVMDGGSWTALN